MMALMSIRAWPESERPRERLKRYGPRQLSDSELLAVLLGSGSAGVDALSLARGLLSELGGLAPLLAAQPSLLLQHPGLGWVGYCRLQAGVELGRRFLAAPRTPGAPMTDPGKAAEYFQARLVGLPHELFCCLFLDTRHRLICCEELFRGTLDGAAVYPREVVKRALFHNAGAVILGHNHPSGSPEPSEADQHITGRLKAALGLIEVRVLDHIIVGSGEASVSLARRGLL
jgi:DNA repair protein RadC